MWQSGQYRAAVIKPLPIKYPAIIDEFPLGRAELSLRLERQERGILSMEADLAEGNSHGVEHPTARKFTLKLHEVLSVEL